METAKTQALKACDDLVKSEPSPDEQNWQFSFRRLRNRPHILPAIRMQTTPASDAAVYERLVSCFTLINLVWADM
jgi:hypothetical protein